MSIEISKDERADAIVSLQQYFERNLLEPIGDLPAGLLLDFFLEEVGPVIYNKAIADAQAWLSVRVADISGELYEDEFQYWSRVDAKRARR